MASRGHSAKKKKDTQIFKPQEESKDPKVDEAMDGQGNIIRNEFTEEKEARTQLFMNPFAQRPQA